MVKRGKHFDINLRVNRIHTNLTVMQIHAALLLTRYLVKTFNISMKVTGNYCYIRNNYTIAHVCLDILHHL